MTSPIAHVLTGLERALASAPPGVRPLVPLADTGLAHWHVRLGDTGTLARIPKQSQMQLAAADNLTYQRACFERAAISGHAPRLHRILPPSDELPRGALIVEEIRGLPTRLPRDLGAIMQALAAIHLQPLPVAGRRAPLRDADDPLADLLAEVREQGRHLDAAGLTPSTRTLIGREVQRFARLVETPARPPKSLITFDAHPGNFLVDADGRAIIVDLEKSRYAYPSLDLAHATLYTSTTWDVASTAILSVDQVAAAYRAWNAAAGGTHIRAHGDFHVPLRRAMWLWSVTWCAKWRALSPRAARADGEDWSTSKSEDALVAHVRGRVDHYLSARIVEQVCTEFDRLDALLAPLPARS